MMHKNPGRCSKMLSAMEAEMFLYFPHQNVTDIFKNRAAASPIFGGIVLQDITNGLLFRHATLTGKNR
jgi:hypothetical protein